MRVGGKLFGKDDESPRALGAGVASCAVASNLIFQCGLGAVFIPRAYFATHLGCGICSLTREKA